MKLEEQVVSLELAKKLNELGFKQDSLFYWADNEDGEWILCLNWKNKESDDPIVYIGRELNENEDGGYYSAFTVAELGEMLPGILIQTARDREYEYNKKWFCLGVIDNKDCQAETEADARAKMLIYLRENSLI